MIETSAFQSLKLDLIAVLGLSKDALHPHVGLLLLFAAAGLWRRPLRSPWPWLTVLTVALAGELLDRRDDLASLGYWRWQVSLHDLLNTLLWPTLLTLWARCGRRPR